MKNSIIKRLVICAVLCALPALASCSPTGDGTGSSDTVTEPAPPADVDLSGVTLIYPAGDKAASACAKELQHGIAELTGTLPFCLPDSQKTSDECADGAVILVGSTDFPESREAYENLKYVDCTVTAAGRRIVVATASDSALKKACAALGELVKNSRTEGGALVVTASALGALGSAEYGDRLYSVPKMQPANGREATLTDCGDDTFMLYARDAEESDCTAYADLLGSRGFSRLRSEKNGKNLFLTYAGDGQCLEISYYPAERELRCIVLPENYYTEYPEYFGGTVHDGSTDPIFTQVGLNYSKVINGMSYILRAPDGSFVIIDGGMAGQGEERHIYDTMVSQSGGKKPVIAAWILTHPHNDHIGAVADFIGRYGSDTVPEAVIFNFINEDALKAGNDYDAKSLSVLRGALSGKWKSAKVIKPHTGERLTIGGAGFTILHTPEDIYPDTAAMAYNNANTVAFMIDVAGRRIMITGDLSEKYEKQMADWYGSGLKCDILQVIHHARTHGNIAVYSLMAPEIAMWPASRASDAEYGSKDFNVWLRKNVPQNIYCYDGTASVDLKTMKITRRGS